MGIPIREGGFKYREDMRPAISAAVGDAEKAPVYVRVDGEASRGLLADLSRVPRFSFVSLLLLWPLINLSCNGENSFGDGSPPDNSNPYRDKDNDGIQDRLDDCPRVYGLTRNGCPPDTVLGESSTHMDSDGDGVPDLVDRCPYENHATQDGCPAQQDMFLPDGGETSESRDAETPELIEPSGPNTPQLIPCGELFIQRDLPARCAQLASNIDGGATLIWQEDSIVMGATTIQSAARVEMIGLSILINGVDESPLLPLCNIKRAAVVTSQGLALLWGTIRDGNELHLMFRSAPTVEPIELAVIPLPRLESLDNKTLASMMAADDDTIAVTWADRDSIRAQIFSSDGNVIVGPFTANRRPLDVLNVINPDVAIAPDGSIHILWQEGDRMFGELWSSSWTQEGERICEDAPLAKIEDSAALVRSPTIALSSAIGAVSWISEDFMGQVQLLSGECLEDAGTRIIFGNDSDGHPDETSVMTLDIAIDAPGRLATQWLSGVAGERSEVRIGWAADGSTIQTGLIDSGIVLGGTLRGDRAGLVSTMDNIILSAFAVHADVIGEGGSKPMDGINIVCNLWSD